MHVALGKYPCPDLWLATAYVPPQDYGKQFPVEEALKKGTLWPDLYSPYPSDP
ncbi:MAG: spore coat associated protein CotJA [Bacillota bacterium]